MYFPSLLIKTVKIPKLVFLLKKQSRITDWSLLFTWKMTTRNKRKLAALNKENCEEHPRSNLAQNSNAPRSQEDYITQVFEEIEGRVTKRLSKEFSRTENRILGALARLDDFLMNLLLQGHSGTTPEPSRNALSTSVQARERMRTTPRMILILKRASSTVSWHKTLAQKMITTGVEPSDKQSIIVAVKIESISKMIERLLPKINDFLVLSRIIGDLGIFGTSASHRQHKSEFPKRRLKEGFIYKGLTAESTSE